MKNPVLACVTLAIAGCASVRSAEAPIAHQAPAPIGAVLCAVEEAESFGFYPEDDDIEEESVRLERRVNYTVADALREFGTRVVTLGFAGRNRLEREYLTLTENGEVLRAQVIAVDENGNFAQPTRDSVADAQLIVSACAA